MVMVVIRGMRKFIGRVKEFQGGGGERSAALSQENLARDLMGISKQRGLLFL